jgi:hypothetical protein
MYIHSGRSAVFRRGCFCHPLLPFVIPAQAGIHFSSMSSRASFVVIPGPDPGSHTTVILNLIQDLIVAQDPGSSPG